MNLLAKAHVRLLCNEDGASMIEYALLVAAVAGAAVLIIGDAGATTGLMGKIKTFVDGIPGLTHSS